MENFIVRYTNKIQGTLSYLGRIDNFGKAQKLADDINVKRLHRQLDKIVRQYCPVIRHFANGYHWSIMQIEYATGIIFKRKSDLKPISGT